MSFNILLLLTCCVLLQTLSSAIKLEGTNTQISQKDGVPNDFNANTAPFQKIGSKYYFIEKVERTNWFAAMIKCHQIGGNLANLRSLEEIREVEKHLKYDERYWVDLSNFSDGKFRSLATGELKGSHPAWHEGEPNNARTNENCAHVYANRGLSLFDDPCSLDYLYICESKTPKTITIVMY